MIIPVNISSTHQQEWLVEHKPVSINGEPFLFNLELVHAGIQRDIKGIGPTIDSHTSIGRKTLYALMGSRFYGKDCVPIPTPLHIYQMYRLSQATYCLECLQLSKEHITMLELFQ